MARNKKGLEMAAGYKTKEDVQLAKTIGAYEVELDKGIVESSSEGETPVKKTKRCLIRIQKAIRRAARKRQMMNKKGKISVEIPDKRYVMLVLYHQLNYAAIQGAVKELGLLCTTIDNTHLWINNVDKETCDKATKAFLNCHFKTKQGKEYKVRIAVYADVVSVRKPERTRGHSNNTDEAKLAAKKTRKAKNIVKAASWVGHKQRRAAAGKLRSQKKANHKPGITDTSTFRKKALVNAKKAAKMLARAEKNLAAQAKSRASKPIPKAKSGKPGKQLVMAA